MECYVIASGKGGTGKTTVTAGVGTALAARGLTCLVIDGDVGVRSLDLTLGMYDSSPMDFLDVAEGRTELMSAVEEHPTQKGLFLLAAPAFSRNIPGDALHKVTELAARSDHFDFVLIDAPAGISEDFQRAANGASRAIIVATPDVISLRSADRTATVLEGCGVGDCRLVVNRVRPRVIERNNTPNIDDAMDMAGLPLLGMIPEDENVLIAGALGHTIAEKAPAHKAFSNIAARLDSQEVPLMRIRFTR